MNGLQQNTVVVICGPTAVGKTALAMQLAQHFGTQIISADSRQCFVELNIGVAKPSVSELASVQHHFIDSHHIYETVNAGLFERFALQAANQIFANNHIAVMVGGTGLYIQSFCDGIDVMPTIAPEIRDAIKLQYQQNGLVWLQQQVQEKDPAFWKIAEQQNPQRLMRALELVIATKQSATFFRAKSVVERPFHIVKIGLELPRLQLNERINLRVDGMIEAGLFAEAEVLLPQRHLNALQTVGYKELFDYFDEKKSLAAAIEQIKINTRQYAKRQMTWFKKDTSIQWLTPNSQAIQQTLSLL